MINWDFTSVLRDILTIVISLIASSGFWLTLTQFREKRTTKDKLLMGLAHDRIVYLAMHYIKRGYVTREEYESIHDFLYLPYFMLGGNGTAKRLISEVEKLPIHSDD
jgi:hypothetical protein